ncbi:MAG: sodium:solute symporter [Bacteroidales bacterium]|nr:sodium:solute symporter [Bacteroidales bacterium]
MELTILFCFLAYTVALFFVMWLTQRKGSSGNEAFFRAGRRSPWPVVAYGMIGASLSGVTFMSVPGGVYAGQWTYMPLVFGYVLGYAVIAAVLLPLYYKLNLTSIYTYLGQRFGARSEKTGAAFFILSRLLGSALRMYLVVFVLYEFVFRAWGIPFWIPAVVFIAIILLYTFRGGIKTVVWTDMLQTTFLLLAAAATVVAIVGRLDMSVTDVLRLSADSGQLRMFETDPSASKYWIKQVVSGMFITITMTGLDQDMMQKNLTCKTLRDAQKNVMTSSMLFIVVNLLFLCLGSTLLVYASQTVFELPTGANGAVVADKIFPSVAFSLSGFTAVMFVLGMVAAGYSSADGTLTALTTTFCYNFLDYNNAANTESTRLVRRRRLVHVTFALLYLLVIIGFRPFHRQSLIDTVFDVAGFTYGPLLGLYSFGLFVHRRANDRLVPYIAVLSPLVCLLLKFNSAQWFGGYQIGFEILLINGLITFLMLLIFSKKETSTLPMHPTAK